jgi:hypothetical protein
MPRKGKKTKHTAAELASKIAAHKPRGGGEHGIVERKPTTALRCKVCGTDIHNLGIMKTHYGAKHPATVLNEADYTPA